MRPLRAQQTAFSAGELAPAMLGRTQVARWDNGAAEITNGLVRPLGSVRKRPAMAHLIEMTGDALVDQAITLMPFAFNVEQSYLIIVTPGRLRIVLAPGSWVADMPGMPWDVASAANMSFAQAGDSIILFDANIPPMMLRRGSSHTDWSISVISFSGVPTHDFGSGAESIFSGDRGFPRCGCFHGGRLWMGGFRSRPASFTASVVGDFSNLNQGTGLADEGIYGTIDADQVNAIQQMVSSRTVQIFTNGAEYAVTSAAPITPENIAVEEMGTYGSKPSVPTTRVDGATLFVQRQGNGLQSFAYSDIEQQWVAESASLLAPHLVKNPSDLTARRAAGADSANNVLLVCEDGTVSVLTVLRRQEITAWSRWSTAGVIRAACSLADGSTYFAVKRGDTTRIELWHEGMNLDAARAWSFAEPVSSVSGTAYLAGQQVRILGDGNDLGTVTVSGDTVALPLPCRQIEIGLDYVPRVLTLPQEPRDPVGNQLGVKCRVVRATARVLNTGPFRIQGVRMLERELLASAQVLDSGQRVFTGDVTLRGIRGWGERHQVLIEGTPGMPFELLSLGFELGVV